MRAALLLLLVLFPLPLAAAPVPKGLKKPPDAERLVGNWRVTALDGKVPDGKTEYLVVEAEGRCRMTRLLDDETAIVWTWALGADESPKRITLTRAVNGEVYVCSYELDGDSLRLAYPTGADKPPPAKVAMGEKVMLFEMTREPAN